MRNPATPMTSVPGSTLRRAVLAAVWTGLCALGAPVHAASGGSSTARDLLQQGNAFWTQQVAALGGRYRPAGSVVFERSVKGVCGIEGEVSGPFYCPADDRLYLDEAFLKQLSQRSPSGEQTALAYLVGHELGLHVENLVGTTSQVEQARSRLAPAGSARLWVTAELQADCYAGVWLHWARDHEVIRFGDSGLADALASVAVVTTQWQAHLGSNTEMIDPLNYSTPAQRLVWVRRGLDKGQFNDCDAFKVEAAGQL